MGKTRKAYTANEREAYARSRMASSTRKRAKELPTASEMEERHKEYLRLMRVKAAEEEDPRKIYEGILKRRREEAEEEKEYVSFRASPARVVESAFAREFAEKERLKEEERAARRVRAAASKEVEKVAASKKEKAKYTRKLAKRLGVNYVNPNELESKYYDESIAAGVSPTTASRTSKNRAWAESDPAYRFLSSKKNEIGAWADLLNIEEELAGKPTLLEKAAAAAAATSTAVAATRPSLEASKAKDKPTPVRTPVLPIPVSANRLERIGGDFVKLAVRNLPIDVSMKKLYARLGGKHIFPDKKQDEKLIVKMKLPTEGRPVTKKGRTVIEMVPRGFAFLTYANHELAQRVLDYHRVSPIMFNHKNLEPPKEMPVLIEPSYTVDKGLSTVVEGEDD
jgi:hypothetical protein